MPKIEIYTRPMCGYCHAAKRLLGAKNAGYTEYDVGQDAQLREEMERRSQGRRTVPQIFIDDTHVGGYDDLSKLERAGKLDPMLAG